MVDEDINEDQTQDSGQNELKSELKAMQEQLAEMNQQYQANMQAVVDQIQASKQEPVYEDTTYMTDEEKRIKALEAQISEMKGSSVKQTQEMIRKERELDNTVVRLSRDYPEIQADAAIQQEVVKQHNMLPKNLQDTAEGYELAVNRVARNKGLIPKNKRTQDSSSEDFSSPGRKSGSGSQSKAKGKSSIDPKTLAFAQALGRDIEDPKVLEGLEKASQRDNYLRYR